MYFFYLNKKQSLLYKNTVYCTNFNQKFISFNFWQKAIGKIKKQQGNAFIIQKVSSHLYKELFYLLGKHSNLSKHERTKEPHLFQSYLSEYSTFYYTLRYLEINRNIFSFVILPMPYFHFYLFVLDQPYLWSNLLVEFHNYFRK